MVENFPKLVTYTKPHIQEAQTQRMWESLHLCIPYSNQRQRKILNEAIRKKHLTNRGTGISITAGFSSETIKQEGNRVNYLKYRKKNTTNLKFYIQ